MRLGLTQQLRTEQRLVQSPQMIQAMQILQCPMFELRDQIEQELQENIFLEIKEEEPRETEGNAAADQADPPTTGEDGNPIDRDPTDGEKLESQFAQELEQLEQRVDYTARTPRGSEEEADRRLELLYNAPDPGTTLSEHLLEQARMLDLAENIYDVVEFIVFSLDGDGRLGETAEQIATDRLLPIPLVEDALRIVRSLDPTGVGAKDLRDCLLLQLDSMSYVRPLTRLLVEKQLDALAMNKLPKIAKDTGSTIDEVKDSWAFIRNHLRPHPGSGFSDSKNSSVVPDVMVDDIEGRFEIRTERGSVPDLSISKTYRSLLKEARNDPKIYEYLRRKIEAAKWFIEAVHQRQNTIQRIASEIVHRQENFLREGVQHLKPMKMQDVADAVGVHISTVSRAISGKYIQTPQGIFAIKRFFSGGTLTDSGKEMSQQAVKAQLKEIVAAEDKQTPQSDDQLVEALSKRGVHIARRTVTKYRKSLGIESSSRRREY